MTTNISVTFFPVANGDCTLFRFGKARVLVDLNYRDPDSDSDDEIYDVAPDLRAECERADGTRHLDVFVLTHPDEDHLRGAKDLFHLGPPDKFPSDTKKSDRLIMLDEIWTTSYVVESAYTTDESESLVKEIRRRNKLKGEDAAKDGNRLKVMDSEANVGEQVFKSSPAVKYRVLAPTPTEADLEQSDDPDERVSCNDTSLVIRWTVTVDGKNTHVLLAGDAGVGIWDRLNSSHPDGAELAWDILLAPHHCSRSAFATRDIESDEYEDSDDALAALGHKNRADAFVVASCRRFDPKGEKTPPHQEAKDEYLKILAKDAKTSAKDRFCQPEIADDDSAIPVTFDITSAGPTKKAVVVKEDAQVAAGAFHVGGRYG